MNTWSLTGGGLDRWLGRTSRNIQGRAGWRSSPAAAPKSMPFVALATHQGVLQRGLKHHISPGFLPRNRQRVLSWELSKGRVSIYSPFDVCSTLLSIPVTEKQTITDVRAKSSIETVETMIRKRRLRWLGHVVRM